jgi:hypothetical protein
VAFAIEQLQTKLGLQRLDLMAHGSLGYAEFVGRSRKAPVARRRIKRPQRVQWWKGVTQYCLLMKKIRAGPKNDALRIDGTCFYLFGSVWLGCCPAQP